MTPKPKPRLPANTRTTTTQRTTGKPGTVRYPANPVHVAIQPPAMIPLPYANPAARAATLTNQQINAGLTALPTQETVAAPYMRQNDALTQLSQSLMQHLQQAAAYRSDLGAATSGMTQQQGAQAAQSIGGASPEAAAGASGDAATLGSYGTNAGQAVAAELGSVPGWTSQYQSKLSLALQQELDRQINQPRQTILAQRPSIEQTLLSNLINADTQVEAQNQNAQTQGADLALRAQQLGVQGYAAATSRGVQGFNATTPTQTNTTTQTANPAQDTRDAIAARDKFTRYVENRADALFKQHSTSSVAQKPGYYVTYRYSEKVFGAPGSPPHTVQRTGRVWVDEHHGEYLRQNAGTEVDLSRYLHLPKGSVKIGNLQPVGAGSKITTYSGQGYGDATQNLEAYARTLSDQFGLGYTEADVQRFAQNAVDARWVAGSRGRPAG